MNWGNWDKWRQSAKNTAWCLFGCSLGDLGTIAWLGGENAVLPTWAVMSLAMFNGVLVSVLLETFVLLRQMAVVHALRTALGMSLISMLAMEVAMNLVDFLWTGGAIFIWEVLPWTVLAGFVAAWPYNYWRLEKTGQCCHG